MNAIPPSIGTWLSTGSPVIAELAALSGFDWVLLDLEHGNESEAALPNQLRGLRGSRTRGIVRVGAPHADLISRVLDWGAHGIMVPHVNSAAEAARIVQSAHYAPRSARAFTQRPRLRLRAESAGRRDARAADHGPDRDRRSREVRR